jgi:NADPH-dependent glutamate synthase beta subunit-like oxidoreductase
MTAVQAGGIDTTASNTISVNNRTFITSRAGVFAAGDVVSGPKTVIQAIAAGKKVAVMIDRYMHKLSLQQPIQIRRPKKYIEPWELTVSEINSGKRAETPRAPADWRKRNFTEVEVTLTPEEARREARRCLRCDLEFTQQQDQGSTAD